MQAYIDKKFKESADMLARTCAKLDAHNHSEVIERSKENIINYVIKSFYEMYQLTCVLEFDNVMSLLKAQQ